MLKQPRYLVLIFAAAAVPLLAWLVLRWMYPPFTPPALPVPNGYDDLLRAAEMLAPRTGWYDEMPDDELAEIVAHNKPALALARVALQKECGVPVDWSRDPSTGMAPDFDKGVRAMRELARTLAADMRKKVSDGMGSDAASSGLIAFQLGKKCYQGGLVVDYLVGLAIQGVSIHELRRVAVQFPDTRTAILAGLRPLLKTGETEKDVIQRETDYIKTAVGGLMGWVTKFNLYGQQLFAPAVKATQQAAQRSTAQQRLFLLHLAVNIYHDQHDSWPKSLDDLAPNILPTVYLDPYSHTAFVYRAKEESYQLYSVGQNGVDDGGTGDETGLQPDFVDDFIESQP